MYAILKVVNGSYSVHAEGIETIEAAKTMYHGVCQTLWNAPDVKKAVIMLSDENLGIVDGYRETIKHSSIIE